MNAVKDKMRKEKNEDALRSGQVFFKGIGKLSVGAKPLWD